MSPSAKLDMGQEYERVGKNQIGRKSGKHSPFHYVRISLEVCLSTLQPPSFHISLFFLTHLQDKAHVGLSWPREVVDRWRRSNVQWLLCLPLWTPVHLACDFSRENVVLIFHLWTQSLGPFCLFIGFLASANVPLIPLQPLPMASGYLGSITHHLQAMRNPANARLHLSKPVLLSPRYHATLELFMHGVLWQAGSLSQ